MLDKLSNSEFNQTEQISSARNNVNHSMEQFTFKNQKVFINKE